MIIAIPTGLSYAHTRGDKNEALSVGVTSLFRGQYVEPAEPERMTERSRHPRASPVGQVGPRRTPQSARSDLTTQGIAGGSALPLHAHPRQRAGHAPEQGSEQAPDPCNWESPAPMGSRREVREPN